MHWDLDLDFYTFLLLLQVRHTAHILPYQVTGQMRYYICENAQHKFGSPSL